MRPPSLICAPRWSDKLGAGGVARRPRVSSRGGVPCRYRVALTSSCFNPIAAEISVELARVTTQNQGSRLLPVPRTPGQHPGALKIR